MTADAEQARLLRRFSWAYPLTIIGAHIAFVPFFALLLPRRITQIVGDASVVELSWVLLVGAVVASLANIVAGHWSDRWLKRFGSRRGIILIGLALLSLSYVWLSIGDSVLSIGAAIVIFQLALNIFFAPASALLSDYVPDQTKGRISGWSNTALPIASVFTALLAVAFPKDNAAAFLVTACAVVLCATPLLALWPRGLSFQKHASTAQEKEVAPAQSSTSKVDFAIAWFARFLIQIGAAVVLGYLFSILSLQEGRGGFPASATTAMTILPFFAAIAGFSSSIASGYASDKLGRRRVPMALAAAIAAASLAMLALGGSWTAFIIAYTAFHLGLTAFLAIDTALVAQLLSGHSRRGMLLGMMNLTNTLPAILGPVMTLMAIGALTQIEALQTVTGLAAVAAFAAGILILRIRTVR